MDIKKVLKRSSDELRKNNVSEPEKSAEFLLRQILDWDKAKLLTNLDYDLSKEQEKKLWQYIERRKEHEPVWYITGKIEFYGLDLEVNQDVLIPRPETELLVEQATQKIQDARYNNQKNSNSKIQKILELGTGSGAIILAVAKSVKSEMENVKFFASDISGDALKVARKNAKKLGFEKATHKNFAVGMVKTPGVKDPKTPGVGPTEKLTIEFREGDLFEPWTSKKFDIIVANLPYIPHEDMASLALDIHHWEPRTALDGGKEGLEIYERLLAQAGDYLNEDAMMFFEIGIGQGVKIKKLVKKHFPKARVEIKKDYAGIDRIAVIKVL